MRNEAPVLNACTQRTGTLGRPLRALGLSSPHDGGRVSGPHERIFRFLVQSLSQTLQKRPRELGQRGRAGPQCGLVRLNACKHVLLQVVPDSRRCKVAFA